MYAFVGAAESGRLTSVDIAAAVARGVDVNGRRWGETALHCAVSSGHVGVVRALLGSGANVSAKDDEGATCVRRAADNGTVGMLEALIAGGGSVNEADNDGETPLIAVARSYGGDVMGRLSQLLRVAGLNMDATHNGMTAEQWAVDGRHRNRTLASAIAAEVRTSSA
jgi:ankyrin repeat protein